MKHTFSRISHSLLLGSSIFATSMTPVSASDDFEELQIAMHKPASTLATHFSTSILSAEKMLKIADKLSSTKMSLAEEKLEFALIFSAARKGSAEAQFRLANYYLDSDIVAADDNEASFWLEEAMAQGHQGAQFIYDSLGVADFDIGC